MKKLIYTVIACSLITTPAFADDFAAMQANKLGTITGKLEKYKENPQIVDYLNKKKACVEHATNADEFKACIEKFPPAKIEEMKK
ncbi:MAG: hypothetical protein ABFR63_01700 [Thermodesulfobacteriota bacterium]